MPINDREDIRDMPYPEEDNASRAGYDTDDVEWKVVERPYGYRVTKKRVSRPTRAPTFGDLAWLIFLILLAKLFIYLVGG